MKNWYLIQFKPNSHRLAERHLKRQGFKTFLPMQEVTVRSASKFTNSHKPLFPGYMFINIDLKSDSWQKVSSTVGVSRMICVDGIPKSLPAKLVSTLMARCDNSGTLLPSKKFQTGDSVKLVTGAFATFVATVETVDNDKRVWLLLEFMGQHAKVQVASERMKLTS